MKSTLTILFLFLFCQVSWAQSRVTTKLPQDHNLTGEMAPYNSGFGVKGGVNYSTLQGDGTTGIIGGVDSKTSYHAGVFTQFRLSNNFSLQPELLYSRRGYRGTPSIKLDYLDLPVLAVYNLAYRWSIHAGPQASFLVTLREDDKEMDRGDYRATDIGGAVGAEFRAAFARAGVRYNQGFLDVRTGTAGLKNSLLQFYVGVGF
jgi:hypothetical protein